MARWRICDENWYWYISFLGPLYVSDAEREVYQAMGMDAAKTEVINLWPCRKCGAMVMGTQRTTHEEFHREASS